MPIVNHVARFSVEGTFNAKEAVAYITSVLVGSNYLYGADESRIFEGTISVAIKEVLPDADESVLGDEMRIRDVSQQSNGAGVLSRESSGQSLTL